MSRNITLVGFMGTGKTTVGRILAERLGYTFLDVDHEVEMEQGVTIAHIFSELGEAYFRMLERDKIKELCRKERLVISAGGGAVLDTRNVDDLRLSGPVVCLTAKPEEILKRVGGTDTRPLLQVPDPMAKVVEMLEAREPFYARADCTIDTSGLSPQDVASIIIKKTGL
jgi:shikimate kinase